MKIFLDTEFTSLKKPKLISIGMVSEDGQEFYRELTDGWKIPNCSHFVLAWVLPWLSNGQVGNRLYDKLQSHLDLVQLHCDADNLFPASKESLLDQALWNDPELLEHFGWLSSKSGIMDQKIALNKFVLKRIGGYQLENLLTGDQAQTRKQVQKDIQKWLQRFQKVQICCDSDYDIEQLKELLGRPFEWELIKNKAVRSPEWQLHHALSDARAMKEAFFKPEGQQKKVFY